MLDTMATDSSDSDSEVEQPLPIRLYSTKPRSLVQRRATITGASPTTKHGIDIEQFWKELKQEHCTTFQLRDKAASCAHGLDNVPSNIRPQTCLGIEPVKRRKKTDGQLNDRKVQFQERLVDTESTVYSEEAKKMTHDTKERVIPAGICENGGTSITSKDITNKEHSRTMDNASDNNNLSDMTVPLDECNNFISDACSISGKNSPGNKEIIGVRYVKERGKLDKSYSTPAYDLSDPEDKENKKLALLESPFCKLDLSAHCSSNGMPSGVTTKVDAHTFIESTDDYRKSKDAQNRDHGARRCGNVARKVSDIEKQIAQIESAVEQAYVFGVPKELDLRKMNDASSRANVEERNQSNIECNISNTCDKYSNVVDLSTECEGMIMREQSEVVCSRKSSPCNCREKNCSHSEMSCSSSSAEGDTISVRFGQVLQMLDGALAHHSRLIEKKSSTTLSQEDCTEMTVRRSSSSNASLIEGDLSNAIHSISKIQISNKPQIKDAKSTSDSSLATVQSCRYIELPKIESVRKYENKYHATPPEPPPRSFHPKQVTDVKLNNAPRITENSEKPQVPERPSVRRELKKVDLGSPCNHAKSNSDCQDRKDSSPDVCAFNYTENALDFIDEPRVSLNDQKFTQSDASLYSENNDRHLREDRYTYEKCEPFVEKFACFGQSTTDGYKSDYSSRHVECPDNVINSKQAMSLDLRPKLLEKERSFEKSVVNRAMMVARSIGLHGSLSKSNSSPRSNRKRNILLTSKYN